MNEALMPYTALHLPQGTREGSKHMEIFWPPVIIGPVAIIIGILIVRYRKSLASGTAEAQRAMFGRFGEFVASQSRPSGALIAGIGFIVIGVAALLMGLFIPPGEWGC